MTTDFFGRPLTPRPAFELDLAQKRQATLLYHWMSLEYLQQLKVMIDALIDGVSVDLALAKAQGRDEVLTSNRWGVRDTAGNWSTHVYPALEDFRQSTIWHIAARAGHEYGKTGAYQCARMISEHSSLWMTPEEEERFKQEFDKVYDHAELIDFAAGAGGLRHQLNDRSMALYWEEQGHLFPRLPKLRVRTDIEAETDKLPPRTGVYVAQDDPYATLQFAWIGNDDGILGEAQTLSDFGRRAIQALGRASMWVDRAKMVAYAADALRSGELRDLGGLPAGAQLNPDNVNFVLGRPSFTTRPCKWYFVEKIEGEYDDGSDGVLDQRHAGTLRCEAGQPCPREGWWFTPASAGGRRHFKLGEVMPAASSDYGQTIWQWDEQQS